MTAPALERETPMAPPRRTIDLNHLAYIREARYKARMEAHYADPNLDPRMLESYADRTIVRNDGLRAMLGLGENSLGKVNKLTDSQRAIPRTVEEAMIWHAMQVPTVDWVLNAHPEGVTVIEVVRILPAWYKGTLNEWGAKTHRFLWDPDAGIWVPNLNIRTGPPKK